MAEETGGTRTAAPGKTCAYHRCVEPAWPDSPEGHCLYHWQGNGQDGETARRVWQEAWRRARAPKGCDCRGWHFPQDPDEGGFDGATFQGHAWFLNASFQGDAGFSDATFQDDAFLSGATFQGEAEFKGAIFQGAAVFWDATFQGDAWFAHATFQGAAEFWGATFQGAAGFGGAIFQGDAWFEGAMARLGVYVVFDLPSAPLSLQKPKPFRRREEGETAYRLAKQAAQNRGDYRQAGDYHYAEQCAIECGRRKDAEPRPWRKGFWGRKGYPLCLLELIFARCLFGYGEKPHRALVAGALVVLLCSVLYWGAAGIMPGRSGDLAYQPGRLESGYFSLVTFTTLGYGDLQPKPGWPRIVAGIEAAFGAALMALFIVGLARKYTR